MAAKTLRLLALLGALAFVSCARMTAPPGGPEDETGPSVAFALPQLDAISVDRNSDVTLEFSEPVNRASIESALYLSPEPGRRLRYRWSGRTLTLDYLDPLPEDRTIVVSVGTQARDLRGNRLENSYTLAFSTGERIDRGEVAGQVALPPETRAVTVTAYLLSDSLPDPMSHVPDYRIQTGTDGKFDLTYLAEGRYRLFALDDRNMDGLWSPAGEWIGTASADPGVRENQTPFVTFAPFSQDTTPPAILRARQADEHRIELRLNCPGQPTAQISATEQTLYAEHFSEDTSASYSWRIFFADTLSGDSATISVRVLGEELTARYAIHNRSDTTSPVLAESFPVNRSMTRQTPDDIILIFSEPIIWAGETDSARVVLSADTIELAAKVEQSDPASVTVTPSSPFSPGVTYTFELPGQLIRDYAGNALADSLLAISWSTYLDDSLGTITGTIRGSVSGPWLVELYEAEELLLVDSVSCQDAFALSYIPAGDYLIRVVRDANGNRILDRGAVTPFAFSESFVWHPDTVSVRARWTNELEILWPIGTQP